MNKQKGFGIVEIIIIVGVVALLGTIGVVAYNSFQKNDDESKDTSSQTASKPEEDKPCSKNEDTSATSGIFCSEEMGIKLRVPAMFKDKLVQVANYEIFKGPKGEIPGMSVGSSELVYGAKVSGTDNFTFTIAKEPLRSGYIGFGHALQHAYYDKDSHTLTTEMNNTEVPSFVVGKTRFYKGQIGDAGVMENVYLAVIKEKFIKIKIHYTGYMGADEADPSTIDPEAIFTEVDEAVKKLVILE